MNGRQQVREELVTTTLPDPAETVASVFARDLQQNDTLVATNPTVPTLPASNTKLVTAARAFAELGADYRFDTTVYADGDIQDGTLLGDLVIVGSGAPDIAQPDLLELAEKIAAAGIRTVAGEVVVDASAFGEQALGPGWTWDDGQYEYGAKSTPLALNRNTVDITVTASECDVEVNASPTSQVVRFDPDVDIDPEQPPGLEVYKKRASEVIRIEGSLPPHETIVESSPVDDPMFHAASVFESALESKGIAVDGWTRIESESVSVEGPPLATTTSRPLDELVEHMLHRSDNFYAEQFARAVARELSGVGTWSTWEQHATEFVDSLGAGPVRLRDGSGVSRYNLLSAHGVVSVLEWSWRQSWGDRFYQSLPRGGRDGTVADRLENVPAPVRAKTGTLTGVRALSGFIEDEGAPRVVFSCLLSSLTDRHEAEAIDRIDALVRKLVERIDAVTVR